eukprot:14399877-Alexandrium_andersonii.AAC.1
MTRPPSLGRALGVNRALPAGGLWSARPRPGPPRPPGMPRRLPRRRPGRRRLLPPRLWPSQPG